jgi:hypothetical protein
MPEAHADGSDASEFTFKLPRTRIPEPIMPGIRGWKTSDGYLVLRLHYTADPDRATQEWRDHYVVGYRGGFQGRDWQREMEIDFTAFSGEAVYSQFDPNNSVRPTRYNPRVPLWRGWDFGYRHPAVVWAQLWPDDTLVCLHELYPTIDRDQLAGLSTHQLAKKVIDQTQRLFPQALEQDSAGIADFCDPAGNQRKENSEFSSIEVLNQFGIDPEWSVVGRKNRINYLREYVEREGKFRVNPHCTLLIKALSSAYRYPEADAGTGDREMPDLGKKVQEEPYVHLMDALEYIAACNLDIGVATNLVDLEADESQSHISELAKIYLQANDQDVRQAPIVDDKAGELTEELTPADLVGEEIDEDSLDDMWLLS